eukprot:Seg1278.11 transcript_id=Seg1278.11/GoldUCD/mRNA.D3Y31 product="hypothetical protein" protein_id=Seg1278.11/GoldUCD/D3Y31
MATVGGYPFRKLLRNCYLSALAGASAGISYRYLKHHPQKMKRILIYSSIAGSTGLGLGMGYGFLRKGRPIFRTSIIGAASFFCMSGAYLGIKDAITLSEVVKREIGVGKNVKFVETSSTGAITGLIIGSFWWKHPVNILITSASFCTVAAIGQFTADKMDRWRLQQSITLKYPELAELEWKVLNLEEQQRLREKNQGYISWVFERLNDRPYIGKLKMRHEKALDDLIQLEDEERTLLTKLNLENDSATIEEPTRMIQANVS